MVSKAYQQVSLDINMFRKYTRTQKGDPHSSGIRFHTWAEYMT